MEGIQIMPEDNWTFNASQWAAHRMSVFLEIESSGGAVSDGRGTGLWRPTRLLEWMRLFRSFHAKR